MPKAAFQVKRLWGAIIDHADGNAAEFARRADISLGNLYDILHGKIRNPQLRTLRRMAAVARVSPSYFLNGSGAAESSTMTTDEKHKEEVTPQEFELLDLLRKLPRGKRERLIGIAHGLLMDIREPEEMGPFAEELDQAERADQAPDGQAADGSGAESPPIRRR